MTMPTTVYDDSMKSSLVVSLAVHAVLLFFLYFGLPVLFKPLPSHHDPVPFEIVEIADLTNTRIKDAEEPVRPPTPEPKPAPKTQTVEAQQPQPSPPKPQPEQKQDQAESIAPKPAVKPKPVEAPKPKTDLLASVLKNVEKLKPAEASKSNSKVDSKDKPVEQKSLAPSLSDRLTITDEDALRRQIEQCWNPPVGARDAQNLIVVISIDVNPDRTVQHAEIADQSRAGSDAFFRAAAESALRALKNPKCTPLELPPDKYEQWKHINFTFDPRDML